MSARRTSTRWSAAQVIAGAVVGIGCGVAVRELTDWPWWIRYPLILVAVFIASAAIEGIRLALARRSGSRTARS